MYTRISRHLSGFRPLALAFIVFSLINILIYLLITLYPPLLEMLWLSTSTPWGIITSAFTHAELGHLVNNLQGFTVAVILFVPEVSVYMTDIRRRYSAVFLRMVFISGILVNLLEYPLLLTRPGFSSWGASGIVYGSLGVLLAACMRSLPAHLRTMPRKKRGRKPGFRFDRGFWKGFRSLLAVSLLLAFLVMIFTDTAGFLSVAPGVDVFAHGFGFLISLGGAMVLFRYKNLRMLRKGDNRRKSHAVQMKLGIPKELRHVQERASVRHYVRHRNCREPAQN